MITDAYYDRIEANEQAIRDYDRDVLCNGEYTHVWRWKARRPDRTGQWCRVLARGKLNSCLVEFMDGERVITSRYAVRLRKDR